MILDGLNSEQLKAVTHIEGPMMIVAGAGSGKTKTLTHRIAYLMQQGVSPYSIMALTFTNKAAKEMQNRVASLVGPQAKGLMMGTFHSVFARMLRLDGEKIGYTRNFTICDDDDCEKLIRDIVKNLNLDEKTYKKKRILNRISNAKCALFSATDYAKRQDFITEDEKNHIGMLYKIYQIYQKRLHQSNSMDFDDILFNMNVLLRDCADVREKYQKRFKYILVDEYQDTNYSQYLIVKKLAEYHRNICVVGDDAQSIYSFRGANILNILNFQKDYPDATTIKLEQNYRSTQNIVNAANSVIEKNQKQIHKVVWTDNEVGNKIVHTLLDSDRDEAEWVGRNIQNMIASGEKAGQIAVLYRTNTQSRAIEDSLRLKNVPYIIYNGTSFYARKEIKDAIAHLRIVVNPYDDEAFLRSIQCPRRGIGRTTLDKLSIASNTIGKSLFTTACLLDTDNQFGLGSKAVKDLKAFCAMVKAFHLRMPTQDAFTLGREVIQRSGLKTEYTLDKDPDNKERLNNINEFVDSMQAFVEDDKEEVIDPLTGEQISIENKTLDVFLQQVSLMTSTDVDESQEDMKVKLMTIHAAKGLEFDNVFVVGMEEDLFPSTMSFASRDDIEEERRIFYVAITRAKHNLYLTSTKLRLRNGELTTPEISRFVEEIDPKYLSVNVLKQEKRILSTRSQGFNSTSPSMTLRRKQPITSLKHNSVTEPQNRIVLKAKDSFEGAWRVADLDEIQENMTVKHKVFGIGVVEHTEVVAGDKRAVVNFQSKGRTVMILKFAKLMIKI